MILESEGQMRVSKECNSTWLQNYKGSKIYYFKKITSNFRKSPLFSTINKFFNDQNLNFQFSVFNTKHSNFEFESLIFILEQGPNSSRRSPWGVKLSINLTYGYSSFLKFVALTTRYLKNRDIMFEIEILASQIVKSSKLV